MKLLKVEIEGFKSFAHKTTILFDGSIVGIVGPNGSGKSNINDAIRWVLSGSATSQLRARAIRDVMFAGSEDAPAAKVCTVSLTFDNRDRRLSYDADRVVVSRTIRAGSGSSAYLINGETASYWQIRSIAFESGISKSSLAVISQGSIVALAEANAAERRTFFEETAGVAKYKVYKAESIKKLERTKVELEKTQRVLRERRQLLKVLERQARNAEVYQRSINQIRELELPVLRTQVVQLRGQLTVLEDQINGLLSQRAQLAEQLTGLNDAIHVNGPDDAELAARQRSLEESLHQLSSEIAQHRRALIQEETKRDVYQQGREDVLLDVEQLQAELDAVVTRIRDHETRISQHHEEIANIRSENDQLLDKIADLGTRNQILHNELYELDKKRRQAEEQVGQQQSHLFRGVAAIIERRDEFPGLIGIIGDLIHYDKKLTLAINTVLGSRAQNIVVRSIEDAQDGIEYLRRHKRGRATFVPIDRINSRPMNARDKRDLLDHYPIIGIGEDLISCDIEVAHIRDYYLGSVIFCQTIQDAITVSRGYNTQYTIVTIEGDILRRSGEIFGGAHESRRESLNLDVILRDIQIRNQELVANKENILRYNHTIEAANKLFSSLRDNIAGLQMELLSLNNERGRLESGINLCQQGQGYDADAIASLSQRLTELTGEEQRLQEEIAQVMAQITAERDSVFAASRNALRIEQEMRQLTESEKELSLSRQEIVVALQRITEEVAQQHGITLDELVAMELPEIADIPGSMRQIGQLRKTIAELSNTHFDQQDELTEIRQDYDNKSRVQTELLDAHQRISETILHLDQLTIDSMNDTIARINSEFSQIFAQMFQGGSAELCYTDPDDILSSGIEIVAQLPGKSVKSIKLFSGGEKSLIIISMLFSVLSSYPLPFCILDEVEAALDDANITRFANFLRRLKDKTQFIVVTHRHGTMVQMDKLLGITMQRRGISSLFSVEVAQAQELIAHEVR